jgi:septum formation protein
LLERLAMPFTVAAPHVAEDPLPGELPLDLVSRLARAKAMAVAGNHRRSIVVGSDQLAACGADILGKPHSVERAMQQLRSLSGQRVTFNTAVHVVDSDSGANESHVDVTTVYFRTLTEEEIRRYVSMENPLDCAGAFKAEGLGIALFTRIESQDPTGLIGLPLIWLASCLRRHGFAVP